MIHASLQSLRESLADRGVESREQAWRISFDVPADIKGLTAIRFTATEMATEPLDLSVIAEAVLDSGEEFRAPHPSLQFAAAVCEANASNSLGSWRYDQHNGQLAYHRWLPCEWLVSQLNLSRAVITPMRDEWWYRFSAWQTLARDAEAATPAPPSLIGRLCGIFRKGAAL